MQRIAKSFQSSLVKRRFKPVVEVLQDKINKNYVSQRYAEALERFDGRILFNSVLDIQKVRLRKLDAIVGKRERKRIKKENVVVEPLPMVLNQLYDNAVSYLDEDKRDIEIEYKKRYQKTVMPFSRFLKVNKEDIPADEVTTEVQVKPIKREIPKNWLKDYELYDESEEELSSQYGTPDIYYPVTNVPCHGCGALLHCKE